MPDTSEQSAAERGIVHNEDMPRGTQLWAAGDCGPSQLAKGQLEKFLAECGYIPALPTSLQNGTHYVNTEWKSCIW